MLEEVLATRYPQLLFLLHTKQVSARVDLPACDQGWIEKVYVQKPSLVLLIGMRHLEELLMIQKWLEKHPDVNVILFEENLNTLAHFFEQPEVTSMINHPQIHLRYILEHADLLQALKEAVKDYPVENILIELSGEYQDKYSLEEISLKVLRRATISSALFHEDFYYHLLFRNLLHNFLRLPECFYADALRGKFQGIPAIVCGAGPSLKQQITLLKELQTKALILAGGSTLAALSSQGVFPHLGFALDPNPEEYDRLKMNQHAEIPLLFGSRVAPTIFNTCQGPCGYMRTFSGGLVEQAVEEKLPLTEESLVQGVSQEGMSVTVMALAAAIRFGCSPIFLVGIDLAYTGGKRYAEGVVQDASICTAELLREYKSGERILIKENKQKEQVHTTIKWVMEAAAIEDFVQKHPHVTVFDAVEGGLGFASLPSLSLEKGREQYLTREYDLQGYIHQLLQTLPTFADYKEEIHECLHELHSSVKTCEQLLERLIAELEHNHHQDPEENPWITLYQMDLTEEKAFQYCLEPLEEAMALSESMDKKERLYKRWSYFQKLLNHYDKLLSAAI